MYISKENILYIHIPKTAGQSVTKYLFDCLGETNHFDLTKNESSATSVEGVLSSENYNERYMFVKNNDFISPGPISLTHMTLQEFITHGYMDDKRLSKTTVFATVRNPYERLISACNFRNVAPDWRKMVKVVNGDKNVEVYRHFMTQYEYILKSKKPAVDNIIKVEDIPVEVPKLFEGRFEAKSIPVINKTPNDVVFKSVIDNKVVSAKKIEDLSKDTIKWINDQYHNDFEHFGYEKL
jgi:hypothetical protein